MLLINENDLEYSDVMGSNLKLKNILNNYYIGEGNVTCGISKWPFGRAGKPHIHESQDEIYIVLRGKGKAVIGEEIKYVIPGDIFYAKSGEVHGMIEVIENECIEMFYFLIPAEK